MAESIGTQIETLIRKEKWTDAKAAIQKQLKKQPDDHWLWSRLSSVKYEQRDYKGALGAAEKALELVPDCPLALWSKAGALDMLGRADEARRLHLQLFRRGLEQLTSPDQDANECWEGPTWTAALMADCLFWIAGWLAKAGRQGDAAAAYRDFLSFWDLGMRGIHSREDALDRLNKLVPSEQAKREAAVKLTKPLMRKLSSLSGLLAK